MNETSFPPLPPGCEVYTPADPLRLVNIGDAPPPLGGPYLIKGVLAPEQVGLLVGAPGCGKSTLGPRIAHAIAKSETLFGRKTAQGPILWVAGEDHVGVIRRFHALNLELGDAPGIFVTTASVNLLESGGPLPGAREVREAADAIGATLIVIDTLAACFNGLDENDARAMSAAVATLRSLASPTRAVLCIHHTPKTGTTPRGHGVLLGDADLALLVEADADGARTLRMLKNRNGPSVGSWRFSIRGVELGRDAEGDAVTAPLAEIDDAPVAPIRRDLPPKAKQALAFLHDLIVREGEPLPAEWQMPPGMRGVPLERWREWCRERGLADSWQSFRMTWKRAYDALTATHRVACREHHGAMLSWPTREDERQ